MYTPYDLSSLEYVNITAVRKHEVAQQILVFGGFAEKLGYIHAYRKEILQRFLATVHAQRRQRF